MMGNFHQDAAANISKLANQIKQLDQPEKQVFVCGCDQRISRESLGECEERSRFIYVITTERSLVDLKQVYLKFNVDNNVNLSRLNPELDIPKKQGFICRQF